ncbi:MAG: 6-phosphogluconolactonase [Flavitalea sp.]
MKAHIYPTPTEVISGIADRMVELCSEILQIKTACNIVLSGGSSPKELYKLLASNGYINKIDWTKINFFFGDERNVPFHNAGNNGKMANEFLFEPLHIKEDHIFYIDTSFEPKDAAEGYEEVIHSHFGFGEVNFDIVLLGLGNNSHTASLFPYTGVLDEKTAGVKEVYIDELKAFRITMTAPLINTASHILFLVYGLEKADAVYNIIRGVKNVREFPAQLIQPVSGEEEWFMDEAAAMRLRKNSAPNSGLH